MALEVRLSDRARGDIQEISDYLAENWSEKAKLDFLIRLTDQLRLISEMPYLFRTSATKKGVRECVLNKNTIIYYSVLWEETIQILTIRNSSRDHF